MADEFLTTRWSMVLAAGQGAADGGAALDYICRTSWRPLYAFARRSGLAPNDAEDAVQSFIASLLASNSLQNVAQDKGRFRTFLLTSLKYHLSDQNSRARAKKRGYITYDELNEALPQDQMSSEQIEDIMSALSEMGINIIENDEPADDPAETARAEDDEDEPEAVEGDLGTAPSAPVVKARLARDGAAMGAL
jgi:DNA-directed RNA polymerase specialized sigma24 family protein